MKRHAHIPKLLWYVLLSVLFVSLLLLSACDSNNPPSDTTAESVEQPSEAPTEEAPNGTDAGTGDGDSFTLPDGDEPTAEPETDNLTVLENNDVISVHYGRCSL